MANKHSTISLTDRRFFGHVQCIPPYASTIEAECNIKFFEAGTVDMAKDSQKSDYVPRSILQIGRRYARVTEYMFVFPAVLRFIIEKARILFEVTHLYGGTFLSSNATDGVFLLKSIVKYLGNAEKSEDDFPAKTLAFSAGKYFQERNAWFQLIRQRPNSTFVEKSCDDILQDSGINFLKWTEDIAMK